MNYVTHICDANDMQMYHVCDRRHTRQVGARFTNDDDMDRTDMRQFFSTRKALKIFPGACPVTDRRFDVYL